MLRWIRQTCSDRSSQGLGLNRFGLLQVSCALLLERRESPDNFESGQNRPTPEQIIDRRKTLTGWFAPQPSSGAAPYKLRALWEEARVSSVASPLNWLDSLTRQDAYSVGMYLGYQDSNGRYDVPALFLGAQASPRHQGELKPRARIPAQRPRVRDQRNLAIGKLDHGDFMVIGKGNPMSQSLVDAQRFLMFLFALRRSTLFASNLRERIYNIWLPPAVLVPDTPRPWADKIAVFPFVGLTRRPNSQAWRFVFTFNAIIIPMADEYGAKKRKLTDAEVGALIGSLDGPSTNPIDRHRGLPRYRVVGDTWRDYALHLKLQGPECALAIPDKECYGTLRNWLELLFFSVARCQLVGPGGGNRYKSYRDKHLADEVLRAIRTTSCWSVLLDVPPGVKPATPRDPSPRDGESWSPKADPHGLMRCFDHMSVGPARWFRPTDDDRVDQGRVGERTWMAWALPMRRCIVTFYFSRAEEFPLRSRLNLFALFGYMIAGLMTSREILVQLGHDVELYRKPRAAAELRRKYVIELEEMFDLDIAWTFYRKLYQRMRRLRGLDDMYRSVKERAEMLAQFSAALDDIKTEKGRTRLSVAAAVLAVAILGVTIWTSTRSSVLPPTIFSAAAVSVAVVCGGWETLQDWQNSLRQWLRRRRL